METKMEELDIKMLGFTEIKKRNRNKFSKLGRYEENCRI